MLQRSVVLVLVWFLVGCGDLPRPFLGNPGTVATQLASPPPARLAVVPPSQAYLSPLSAKAYAAAIVAAMHEEALPAVADDPRPGDWRLELFAELKGNEIFPGFRVRDPSYVERGAASARPVSAASWAMASPEVLRQAGRDVAPTIASLLAGIEAARRDADPDSLVNRAIRVNLEEVRGAPGDGNRSLRRHLQEQLTKFGMVAREKKEDFDYTISGEVEITNTSHSQQRVEIIWKVTDARGNEAGQVVQLNSIPGGALSNLWGDVALVVAQEAAKGVRDVMFNYIGAR